MNIGPLKAQYCFQFMVGLSCLAQWIILPGPKQLIIYILQHSIIKNVKVASTTFDAHWTVLIEHWIEFDLMPIRWPPFQYIILYDIQSVFQFISLFSKLKRLHDRYSYMKMYKWTKFIYFFQNYFSIFLYQIFFSTYPIKQLKSTTFITIKIQEH